MFLTVSRTREQRVSRHPILDQAGRPISRAEEKAMQTEIQLRRVPFRPDAARLSPSPNSKKDEAAEISLIVKR